MEPNNNISTADNGKNVGIVSYITIIGWLIAYFGMHQNNKTELGSYQLRQTLLLHIASFLVSWILGMIFAAIFFSSGFDSGWFSIVGINWIIRLIFVVLWLIGFIGAINGEKKPIPFIGKWAQTLFKGI
ncbi:MAG: DUF4870 domain-containing protein [Mucilaginibacter sp.]|nr:DUF4870 domain-containing protein [Mucilaginibacter sp.]